MLGPPGAGKGTQAELLGQWLSLPRIATGDLFRAAIEERTELGVRVQTYTDQGDLVPDEITTAMVAERLAEADCVRGVIFDGFPRTVAQARSLDALLARMGRQVDVVLYVHVSPAAVLTRLAGRWICRSCGRVYHRAHNPESVQGICDVCGGELYQREDDDPETQGRRMEVYSDQTAPLQEYYGQKRVLVDVDGEQEIAAVRDELREAVQAAVTQRAG